MQNILMFYMLLKEWGEQPNAASSPRPRVCKSTPTDGKTFLTNWSKMQNHSAKSPGDLGDISKEAMMFSYAKRLCRCQQTCSQFG